MDFAYYVLLVKVTRCVPLEKCVWGPRKDPDNEEQKKALKLLSLRA